MKVFLSWSGPLSREVALALRDWLQGMLQTVEPFYSEHDIESGARWTDEIALQLEEMSFGIVCVTRGNADRPWVNFEAGALAKVRGISRVVPLLIGLDPAELTGPLVQFQARRADRDGIWAIVRDLNSLTASPLGDERLALQFDKWWPDLEEQINDAIRDASATQSTLLSKEERPLTDMVAEILGLVRDQQRRIADEPRPFVGLSRSEVLVLHAFLRMVDRFMDGTDTPSTLIATVMTDAAPIIRRILRNVDHSDITDAPLPPPQTELSTARMRRLELQRRRERIEATKRRAQTEPDESDDDDDDDVPF